jgi:hypothetical protein
MKKATIGLLIILAVNNLSAQTEILKDNGSWLTLTNNIKLSNKFYISNVTQQRRVPFLKSTQAFLYAPSINFKFSKNTSIGVGYLHYKYFPEGVSAPSIHKNENRFFQHLIISSTVGKFKLNQRFRFEERVIELINSNVTPNIIDGDKYVNRFRYRLQATTNLFKLKNNNYLLGKLSNEIRIRFAGGGISSPDFDQNNFQALLGYKLLPNSTIWMGYGRYYFRKTSSLYVSNDILHVTLSYNVDLSKKK